MGCHRTATPAGRGTGRYRAYGNLRTDLESPGGGEEPGRRARVHRRAQGPRRPEVAGSGAAVAARPQHRYEAQRLGLSSLPASKRAFARWRKTTGAARGRPGGSAVAGGAKLPASVGLQCETGWDVSTVAPGGFALCDLIMPGAWLRPHHSCRATAPALSGDGRLTRWWSPLAGFERRTPRFAGGSYSPRAALRR